MDLDRFVTTLGCTLAVRPADPSIFPDGGVMLVARMEQEGDGRHVEVYLSDDDRAQLSRLLMGGLP